MLKPSAPTPEVSDNSNLIQILRLQAEINRLAQAKKDQGEVVQLSIDSHINQRRAAQLILYRQIYPELDVPTFDAKARHNVASRLAGMSKEMEKTSKAIALATKDDSEDASPLGEQIRELHEGIKLLGAKE